MAGPRSLIASKNPVIYDIVRGRSDIDLGQGALGAA
jgi:hypothetical protein